MEDIKKYTQGNREAWNEAMPKHRVVEKDKWLNNFADPNFSFLRSTETDELKKIGVKGKNVIHLCCNNGIELMSVKRLGADRCVGVDISDEAIADAKKVSDANNIGCEFIASDVYDTPEELYGQFDLVYVTVGAFAWLPDLDRFFKIASKLLKDTGHFFIYDIHPFINIFANDYETDSDEPKIMFDYYRKEPLIDNCGIDYIGGTVYDAKTSYEFFHPMSEIINGLVSNGIAIERLNEYKEDVSSIFGKLSNYKLGLPVSYILVGKKG